MAGRGIDLEHLFTWDEDLPRPQWDIISTYIDTNVADEETAAVWNDVIRQWFERLAEALPLPHSVTESEHFALIAPDEAYSHAGLLAFAERCRDVLSGALPGIARFAESPRWPIIALADDTLYYRYVSHYMAEGRSGGSAGVQIRSGYPHVALQGRQVASLENTLAHELTHASLSHLTLPQWIEEGLAQMFEHDMTGRELLIVTAEMAREQKGSWKKKGLDEFWRGGGFHAAGKMQERSYQLAEILMRLLVEDHRPRWFGLSRGRQQKFLAFLRDADEVDCGSESARRHLGCDPGEIAARFLGPGDWSPGL